VTYFSQRASPSGWQRQCKSRVVLAQINWPWSSTSNEYCIYGTHVQWVRYVARVEEKRNMCKIFVRKKESVCLPLRGMRYALRPPASRLSRRCGSLDVSKPFRPPRPVTETALLFLLFICSIKFQFIIAKNLEQTIQHNPVYNRDWHVTPCIILVYIYRRFGRPSIIIRERLISLWLYKENKLQD
jgi:hypothetical protein